MLGKCWTAMLSGSVGYYNCGGWLSRVTSVVSNAKLSSSVCASIAIGSDDYYTT